MNCNRRNGLFFNCFPPCIGPCPPQPFPPDNLTGPTGPTGPTGATGAPYDPLSALEASNSGATVSDQR